jgi:hypothetical protein
VVVVVERPVRVLLLRVLEPLLVALLAVARVGRGGDAVLEVGQLDRCRRRAELGPDERLAEVSLALTRLGALLVGGEVEVASWRCVSVCSRIFIKCYSCYQLVFY